MITVHDVIQGTPEWKALRTGKYTGSNAHKLLKFGAIDYSLTETGKFAGNYWTKRGHILEDEAIDIYKEVTNAEVSRPGFVTNDKYPMCGYSPDALGEFHTIEIKCFDEKEHMKLMAGDVKLEILAQVHFGLTICERPFAHLIPYNPNMEADQAFRIILIKANRSIQANFKRILNKHKEPENVIQTIN